MKRIRLDRKKQYFQINYRSLDTRMTVYYKKKIEYMPSSKKKHKWYRLDLNQLMMLN